ncbi:extracellular solute-binding protein [Pseudooceanicola sediminis]|uniref:Extracellular solute-binding protein n=1 Tax=Pseudooceanicola sediminis TaxID=2211117 RepID=A0A399J6E3_9RHOB|nr:ABC transporter substrate-binding protein [Pseudooceanicola sediminis]KAA2317199.1 extracellular solute-binding protein [Puniceibacterium sp. HSS470]RII39552.1 extracellular solute-binding protein [Pseudooceanicola sediminis]|tara:strand:- start:26041 stop:27057 length:1017 start_codon:yes stop_codon:yes gene_type:complete
MKRLAQISALALIASAASAQAETLTISWWGYNGDKLNANIIEPFKAQCGCDVQFETGNNADRLGKLQARGGKGVDVIFLTDAYSQIGVEAGTFQKFDASKVPNIENIYEIARDPQGGFGPAYTVGRIGVVYDSAKIDPITKWDDLWRDDLAGTISLPGITTTAGPMFVVQAGAHAGVDAYEDAEGAFEAVKAIEPNVTKNYNTGSEMVNLISTGEASVTMTQDFTLKSLKDAVPTMTWAELEDGDIAVLNTVNIPTGAENTELAYEFINFLLSDEVQQKEAEQGVDAPINMNVELTDEQAAMWTYGADAIAALNTMDYAKMNANKSDWIDRWNEIFGM